MKLVDIFLLTLFLFLFSFASIDDSKDTAIPLFDPEHSFTRYSFITRELDKLSGAIFVCPEGVLLHDWNPVDMHTVSQYSR